MVLTFSSGQELGIDARIDGCGCKLWAEKSTAGQAQSCSARDLRQEVDLARSWLVGHIVADGRGKTQQD
jgi:hypothetical protein